MSVSFLDFLITVDVNGITAANTLSSDYATPTPLDATANASHIFVFNHGARSPCGCQGIASLTFSACAGDYVSFRAGSFDADYDTAINVYSVVGDCDLFTDFRLNGLHRNNAVIPNPVQQDGMPAGLPAVTEARTFMSLDARVKRTGTANLGIAMAVQTRNQDTDQMELTGYCSFAPVITING